MYCWWLPIDVYWPVFMTVWYYCGNCVILFVLLIFWYWWYDPVTIYILLTGWYWWLIWNFFIHCIILFSIDVLCWCPWCDAGTMGSCVESLLTCRFRFCVLRTARAAAHDNIFHITSMFVFALNMRFSVFAAPPPSHSVTARFSSRLNRCLALCCWYCQLASHPYRHRDHGFCAAESRDAYHRA